MGRGLRPGDPGLQHRQRRRVAAYSGKLAAIGQAGSGGLRAHDRSPDRAALGDNSPPRQVAVSQVALFATPATVASRAFQRELAFRAVGVDVEAQPCGGVVDAIEMGDEILAEALVTSHVELLLRRMPNPEAAILGCTHYPLVEAAFQRALGPQVKVYSQAGLVAESLADYLERRPEFRGPGVQSRFLTTGDPSRVSGKATQFLRKSIRFELA